MPRTVECELTEDLVDACIPGDVVTVIGIIKVINNYMDVGGGIWSFNLSHLCACYLLCCVLAFYYILEFYFILFDKKVDDAFLLQSLGLFLQLDGSPIFGCPFYI